MTTSRVRSNRRGIDQRLALELVRAERNGYGLAVALIDIDHFKQIDQTAGHAAGDAALKQVVEVISSRLRSYDFLGATEATSSCWCFRRLPAKTRCELRNG